MPPPHGKYLDPLSDFGFKHLFDAERHGERLRLFLDAMLPDERQIVALRPNATEAPGERPDDRGVLFDLRCTGADGTAFIVEVQRATLRHIHERLLYYAARAISRSGRRGDWPFALTPLVVIGILDFAVAGGAPEVLQRFELRDAGRGRSPRDRRVADPDGAGGALHQGAARARDQPAGRAPHLRRVAVPC